jgi:hypothetical protein
VRGGALFSPALWARATAGRARSRSIQRNRCGNTTSGWLSRYQIATRGYEAMSAIE